MAAHMLAVGALSYHNRTQQHLGIMNVIKRRLQLMFRSDQLKEMQSTVLNRLEVIVDVRSGSRAVLPTGARQCIPIPLSQLKDITERAYLREQMVNSTVNKRAAISSSSSSVECYQPRKDCDGSPTSTAHRQRQELSTSTPELSRSSLPFLSAPLASQCDRLLILVVVIPKQIEADTCSTYRMSTTSCNPQYTNALMYWVGVIGLQDPSVVHATLHKAGQSLLNQPSLEDCKLLRLDELTRTPIDVQRLFVQWHMRYTPHFSGKILRVSSLRNSCDNTHAIDCDVDIQEKEQKGDTRDKRSVAQDCTNHRPTPKCTQEHMRSVVDVDCDYSGIQIVEKGNSSNERKGEYDSGNKEHSVRIETANVQFIKNSRSKDNSVVAVFKDPTCSNVDDLADDSIDWNDGLDNLNIDDYDVDDCAEHHNEGRDDGGECGDGGSNNNSPLERTSSISVSLTVSPHEEDSNLSPSHSELPSCKIAHQVSAYSPVVSTSSIRPMTSSPQYSSEDQRLGSLAVALLVPPRPTETPDTLVHLARTVCLARQRIAVLACLQSDGLESMQYDRLQMLLYANQDVLAATMNVSASSVLARRSEALEQEQQCAAFLVCLAASLASAQVCAWYMDSETYLGECLYRTLCYTSGARRCAYERTQDLHRDEQSQIDSYQMDAQVCWTKLARRRVSHTIGILQRAMNIDPDTGMLCDTSPTIPLETEDVLCELKSLLLRAYEDYCTSTCGANWRELSTN